jgi:1-deoxy-D-xylulose-5-phosphate synthase
MRFVKPLDEELILEVAKQHALLVTLEENVIAGGAGSAVMEYLARAGREAMVLPLGLPDANLEHGTRDECLREAGLDLQGLFDSIARHAAAMPTTARGGQKRGGLDSNMMFNGVTRSLTRFKLF